MSKIAVIAAMMWTLSGCASLALRSYDNAGVTAAKVLTRIPLGVITLGVSELAIEEAVHGPLRCDNDACRAAILGILGARMGQPAPAYPVYVPTVQQPKSCTTYPVGNTIVTNCY